MELTQEEIEGRDRFKIWLQAAATLLLLPSPAVTVTVTYDDADYCVNVNILGGDKDYYLKPTRSEWLAVLKAQAEVN